MARRKSIFDIQNQAANLRRMAQIAFLTNNRREGAERFNRRLGQIDNATERYQRNILRSFGYQGNARNYTNIGAAMGVANIQVPRAVYMGLNQG